MKENAMSANPHAGIVRGVGPDLESRQDWGRLFWLFGSKETPGAEQTFGIVEIAAGRRNALHSHPTCEEVLYVISGACDHRLGEQMIHLEAGSAIRIPRGVPHYARATGSEPLVAAIAFSSPDRTVIVHEDGGQG
jgi:quercetin dioxygenase-like cupin family protein